MNCIPTRIKDLLCQVHFGRLCINFISASQQTPNQWIKRKNNKCANCAIIKASKSIKTGIFWHTICVVDFLNNNTELSKSRAHRNKCVCK